MVLTVVAAAGCTLDQQRAPGLSGPSGLGLSLMVSATPDIIPQDGSSQSVIQISATDATNLPVVGLPLKTEISFELQVPTGQSCPGGTTEVAPRQCVGLASGTLTTGGDGRASAVYSSPGFLGTEVIATVTVTPIGSNYGSASPRTALIRLAVF
jgi:hypothetical protein